MAKLTARSIAYNFHDTRRASDSSRPRSRSKRTACAWRSSASRIPRRPSGSRRRRSHGLDSTRMDGLREFVKATRESERADLVVAVTHTGLTVSRQIARENPGTRCDPFRPHPRADRGGDSRGQSASSWSRARWAHFSAGSTSRSAKRAALQSHEFRLIPIRAREYPEDPQVKELVDASARAHPRTDGHASSARRRRCSCATTCSRRARTISSPTPCAR